VRCVRVGDIDVHHNNTLWHWDNLNELVIATRHGGRDRHVDGILNVVLNVIVLNILLNVLLNVVVLNI
jgi:hypothetical protein